jgi:hypothetical protein
VDRAAGLADDHEPAAPDVPGERKRDGEGEVDRDRGVDRVAAAAQNVEADLNGVGLGGDDHRAVGTQRVEWRDEGVYLTGWAEIVLDGTWVGAVSTYST